MKEPENVLRMKQWTTAGMQVKYYDNPALVITIGTESPYKSVELDHKQIEVLRLILSEVPNE